MVMMMVLVMVIVMHGPLHTGLGDGDTGSPGIHRGHVHRAQSRLRVRSSGERRYKLIIQIMQSIQNEVTYLLFFFGNLPTT